MSTYWVFHRAKLDEALQRFVDVGPAGTRALRQQEVDGTLNVLLSDAFQDLRHVDKLPPPAAPIGVSGKPRSS